MGVILFRDGTILFQYEYLVIAGVHACGASAKHPQYIQVASMTPIRTRNRHRVPFSKSRNPDINFVADYSANPIPSFRILSDGKNQSRSCKLKQASCAKSDAEMVLGSFVCLFV